MGRGGGGEGRGGGGVGRGGGGEGRGGGGEGRGGGREKGTCTDLVRGERTEVGTEVRRKSREEESRSEGEVEGGGRERVHEEEEGKMKEGGR